MATRPPSVCLLCQMAHLAVAGELAQIQIELPCRFDLLAFRAALFSFALLRMVFRIHGNTHG